MQEGKDCTRHKVGRRAEVARRRPGRGGRHRVECLEPRSLLTVYNPVGVPLSPSPVEGTAFSGAIAGTFATNDAQAGLSAIINWGPAATPTATIGTINLIGSVFVPGRATSSWLRRTPTPGRGRSPSA